MPAIATERPVLVIGAGAMGVGIAQVAAAAGHRVHLFDTRPGAAQEGIAGIGRGVQRRVESGRMTASAAQAMLERLIPESSLEAVGNAALAVEAVVEDLDVKQSLFRALEASARDDCILATNTSSLSVTAIAAPLDRPERVVGMHFFNPAPVMALVEVVSGLQTAPDVARAVADTAAAWGKSPVMARSTPGFIVNRIARPFYAEALRVLQEGGADPATLDAIVRDCGGFRMGPFEVMDLIGHDVNFAVTRSVHSAYFGDPRFVPSIIQQELVAAGRLGRKSGRGFYDYTPNAQRPAPGQMPTGASPQRITLRGERGSITGLLDRLWAAGVGIQAPEADSRGPLRLVVDGVALQPCDGTSATEVAASEGVEDLVLWDLVLDWSGCRRVAIAVADQASERAAGIAAGLFQRAGLAVSRMNDVPGMIVMRTMAMLANEAADALLQGVANAVDIDTAMVKGVGYPLGPLQWADELGTGMVAKVLENIGGAYGEDRYRVSPLLKRLAARGGRFHGSAS